MYTLIDGDILVYSCGFAAEKNNYHINGQDFQYKKDAKKYCVERNIDPEGMVKTIIPDPVEFALSNVKQTLFSIAEACGSNDGTIYLSGKGNFRDSVAVTHPYKGTRDPDHKPYHYKAIKDYLVKHWDAETVEGMEADDAMGIAQCEASRKFDPDPRYWDQAKFNNKTIICSIDKDMDMIPGWHYNFRKDDKYHVTVEEADLFFHKQMLMGDRADNIVGIYGLGEKKSDKLLRGLTAQEREDVITAQYKKEFGEAYQDRFEENAKLLWILREPMEAEDVGGE